MYREKEKAHTSNNKINNKQDMKGHTFLSSFLSEVSTQLFYFPQILF